VIISDLFRISEELSIFQSCLKKQAKRKIKEINPNKPVSATSQKNIL
jgi:hypothetical protein